MAKYLTMVVNYGFAEIEAANEEEALRKAADMKHDDFDWSHFDHNRSNDDTEIVEEIFDD